MSGCDANDTALECNTDAKDCAWLISCSGTVDSCDAQTDDMSCELIDGWSWTEN